MLEICITFKTNNLSPFVTKLLSPNLSLLVYISKVSLCICQEVFFFTLATQNSMNKTPKQIKVNLAHLSSFSNVGSMGSQDIHTCNSFASSYNVTKACCASHYQFRTLAHSAPLFAKLKILDIFKVNSLQIAKCMFHYHNQLLPRMFLNFNK